jgi:carbamate kinase
MATPVDRKVAVVAIGGNSLIKDEAHRTVEDQYAAVCETAAHIAAMVEAGWRVVVTHGNGPQVGFILRRSELSRHELHEVPLDVCGADTQGAIGYMLQQSLQNEFRARGIEQQVVTVVTQVEVDPADQAFAKPSKPIGSFIDETEAERRQQREGWTCVEDAGRGWRRVVPSPKPKRIVELDAVRHLVEHGFTVVAVGGGGIPVIADESGVLRGVAAVIDKDHASSLLAREMDADLFLISTGVERVALNFKQPTQRDLERVTVSEAWQFLREGHFAAGSMRPKIEACLAFLEGGGRAALITSPENIERALRGETGTWIVPDGHVASWVGAGTTEGVQA